ncbi:MAG: hypothetical protein JWO80_5453 [Bryobacterales bacterium]|nr:hypothetical protein [Bryobacterales bacterium]
MRTRSIAGPVVLIAIGVLFLLNNLRPDFMSWDVLWRYWPFLLIGFGVVRLIEVLVDAGHGQLTVRRSGGYGWILLVIFVAFWAIARNHPHMRMSGFENGRLEIFGDEFDYPVSAKGDAAGVTMLVLDNLRGNLTVTGSDTDQFEVEGRKQVRAYNKSEADDADRNSQVKFVREGNQLIVRADQTRFSRDRRLSTDLDIKIPKGVSVEARGRSGDLTVSSINGSVDIASDRGDVRLSGIGGNAKVDVTHSNLVRATDVKGALDVEGRGADVQLENVAGQVTINGAYSGTLEFKGIDKPLHFESEQTDLRIQQIPGNFTMDLGDIRAQNIVGPLRLRTKSRDIHLADFSGPVEIDIERGDIVLAPGKLPIDKIDVHSRNGDVELTLPENARFDLKANTSQGEVHNDFGAAVKSENEGRSGSLRSVEAKGPSITISTERGAVTIRKG